MLGLVDLLTGMCGHILCTVGETSFLLVPQHSIRALALRVLREILRNQPARFKNYAELTIMKTLEAHKDSHKEVSQPHGRDSEQVGQETGCGEEGLGNTYKL